MPQLGFMLGADPSMSIVSRLFTCAVSDVMNLYFNVFPLLLIRQMR